MTFLVIATRLGGASRRCCRAFAPAPVGQPGVGTVSSKFDQQQAFCRAVNRVTPLEHAVTLNTEAQRSDRR